MQFIPVIRVGKIEDVLQLIESMSDKSGTEMIARHLKTFLGNADFYDQETFERFEPNAKAICNGIKACFDEKDTELKAYTMLFTMIRTGILIPKKSKKKSKESFDSDAYSMYNVFTCLCFFFKILVPKEEKKIYLSTLYRLRLSRDQKLRSIAVAVDQNQTNLFVRAVNAVNAECDLNFVTLEQN